VQPLREDLERASRDQLVTQLRSAQRPQVRAGLPLAKDKSFRALKLAFAASGTSEWLGDAVPADSLSARGNWHQSWCSDTRFLARCLVFAAHSVVSNRPADDPEDNEKDKKPIVPLGAR